MTRRAKAGEGKFEVGQVVFCKSLGEWVRIECAYQGRTSVTGRIKQMYVIGWDYGKSTTAVQAALRPLTKRESGQRFRERSK